MQNQESRKDKTSIFDLKKLRLSQDFPKLAEVNKEIITIPVRKPGRQDFIRVHPDESYQLPTALLEIKDEFIGFKKLILDNFEIPRILNNYFVVKVACIF